MLRFVCYLHIWIGEGSMNFFTLQRELWRRSKFLLVLLVFITSSVYINATNWKWEQLPDPNGVDIDFVFPHHLADDWLCESTGPILSICFAYSWFNDNIGIMDSVLVQIWSDFPDPDGPGPMWSHPANMLWGHWFVPGAPEFLGNSPQGWYDPWYQQFFPINHNQYFRRVINIPIEIAFQQIYGTVYWLDLTIALNDPINTKCGWKTTYQPWNDGAVYSIIPIPPTWEPFPNTPPLIKDMAFKLSNEDSNGTCPVELSSFSGTYASGLCQINWVTESETNVQGYNIYRNTDNLLSTAIKLNYQMITATNTSNTVNYQYQDTNVAVNQTYYYWLEANDYDGASSLFGPININTLGDTTPIPVTVTSLSLVYPNPARSVNPLVDASIKENENGVLSIFNVKGQLVNSFNLQSGNHHIEWNRANIRGHKCADGVYFYRLVTPTMTQTRKVLILN
jgi:hypothetical protein